MGYKVGGPLGGTVLGASTGRGQDEKRFQTSYGSTFRPMAALGQGTFSMAGKSSLASGTRTGSQSFLAIGGLGKSASGASLPGLAQSQSPASVQFAEAPAQFAEAVPAAAVSTVPVAAVSTVSPAAVSTMHRETRRRTLELLADPDLMAITREIFVAHDPDRNGKVDHNELSKVLQTLHRELDLPKPDESITQKLFKKFDVNNDKKLDFPEFFELVKSELRRSAFDHSTVMGREFFITKKSAKVWDIFKKTKELGSGTFGTAYLAKRKLTGEERVVKAVQKSKTSLPLDEIEQEILIMRQIDHPNIVRLFEWYEDAGRIYLVLEALKGGTLKEVVLGLQKQQKGLKESWIRKVMGQSVEAMAYVHNLRLIHKDLKDENIMLLKKDPNFDEPFVVIIDLGIAEMFSYDDAKGDQIGGTPLTMAPEVWKGDFGPKCDVFSMGCVFYQMLAGNYPFMANSMSPEAWRRLHKRGPDWSLVKTSSSGKGLCKDMLTFSEDARPSMRQCLEHEFFKMDPRELKLVSPAQFRPFASFCKDQQVKRALLLEIASRLPMDRAAKIVEIFKSLDANRDGNLSPAELQAYFTAMGMDDKQLVNETFKALDVDQDGMLSFSEFAAGALLLFRDVLEERLHALFQRRDPNNDGTLSLKEAHDFLEDVLAATDKGSQGMCQSILAEIQMTNGPSDTVTYEQIREYVMGAVMDEPSAP
mmetsp:Transcript_114929/g.245373  ORF Transcript_114929/g.245373 Transcript_114929/m.245373 type:complete len:703 (+) Transcript_114929:57-2165(+)